MKLYTRGGDKGKTQLIGGVAVSKADPRVEAYGTIDELNAFVGQAAALNSCWPKLQEELISLQHLLFDCGNDLATPIESNKSYRLTTESVDWLEARIDEYNEAVTPLEHFVLPGGNELSALLHVCRTVTRRAERRVVVLGQESEISSVNLQFLNRLSDYFFAAARLANQKLNAEEILYMRGGKVFR